jgi:L-aspartate oxidase
MIKTDVLIVGSGIAALSTAAELAKYNVDVTIVTKGCRMDSNSALAQGGISVALAKEDDWHLHYDDTLKAGCYLNDETATQRLVSLAPSVLIDFMAAGMQFDRNEKGELLFGREAAHCLNRVIHAGGDGTGLKVIERLVANTRNDEHITIREYEPVLELIVKDGRCYGAVTRDKDGVMREYAAGSTIIAAGGIGQLYPATTNDTTITGDSIALASRAGCKLNNLEFVQFHPTMLTIDGHAYGLVSEAVRGAGALLINENGERIMENVHPMKELAPRDVVAREVYAHYLKGEKIYLDISAIDDFAEKFPTVSGICIEHGVDLSKKLIPVGPGAHFHMGGISALCDGRTNIEGLFAVGEAACTGVHGANRLASNSLLEGLVFGRLTADYIVDNPRTPIEVEPSGNGVKIDTSAFPDKKTIQRKMMEFVGIVRHKDEIHRITEWFNGFATEDGYAHPDYAAMTNDEIEIFNMLSTGRLVASAAEKRTDSIGAHYIVD